MTIQKAFITDDAFTVDDHGYAAVVTADYTDKDTGAFEIVCDIRGYCEAVSISLDNNDILAVRELLGIGSPFPCHELPTPTGLPEALRALISIAEIPEGSTWGQSWRDIARQCVEIANSALTEIQSLRRPTDGDC